MTDLRDQHTAPDTRATTTIRTDGGHDPCIAGGSSRDCERGECNARAVCAAADLALIPREGRP